MSGLPGSIYRRHLRCSLYDGGLRSHVTLKRTRRLPRVNRTSESKLIAHDRKVPISIRCEQDTLHWCAGLRYQEHHDEAVDAV